MSKKAREKSSPRYMQVANQLIEAISGGRYPVGSLLPTEMELCELYKTSRHTIREALRRLYEKDMVSRRQGSGTRVISQVAKVKYNQYLASLSDLLQYGAETRFEILRSERISADRELAELLNCEVGDRWVHLHGVRYARQFKRPICTTEIYRPARPDSTSRRLQNIKSAVFVLIDELDIGRIGRVEQTLSAINTEPEVAKELGREPQQAALQTQRRYFDHEDELLLVSVSVHPGNIFKYSTTLQRDPAT